MDNAANECKDFDDNGIMCSLHEELKKVKNELQFITTKIKENDEEGDVLKQWKFAAYVIDRFCVIIFSLLACCVTAGIFFAAATYER